MNMHKKSNLPGGGSLMAKDITAVCEPSEIGEGAMESWEKPAICKPSKDIRMSMSNQEAQSILVARNSGVKPMLNRCGYRAFKRTFDVLASGCSIALLAIPSIILCIIICIKSPGASPIYTQTRVGRVHEDGSYNLFRMYKFRSMVPDADKQLEVLREKNEADGPLFKIREDPRIIPGIGSFIRRHSIDELPQLINVFQGKMSLIGPRPALPREVVQYDERTKQRLVVKAGCGGVWQVGVRSDCTFDDMVSMDLKYVKHCSVTYDLKLMFSTLRAMIVGGVPTKGIFCSLPWAVTSLG